MTRAQAAAYRAKQPKPWYDCGQCGHLGWQSAICYICGMPVTQYRDTPPADAERSLLEEYWVDAVHSYA